MPNVEDKSWVAVLLVESAKGAPFKTCSPRRRARMGQPLVFHSPLGVRHQVSR